jgi:prevent-host-death family protein
MEGGQAMRVNLFGRCCIILPMQVPVEQAKAQLDALIDRSVAGEEVVLTRNGQPVAQVVPAHATNGAAAKGPRQPGWGRGVITHIAPDFDEPLEDFREYTG